MCMLGTELLGQTLDSFADNSQLIENSRAGFPIIYKGSFIESFGKFKDQVPRVDNILADNLVTVFRHACSLKLSK